MKIHLLNIGKISYISIKKNFININLMDEDIKSHQNQEQKENTNNSEITSFFAFSENNEKFEIKMFLANHNDIVFQCLIKEEISLKEYKKVLSFEELKNKNKLFYICDNINDIKAFIIDYINNATSKNEKSIIAVKEEKKLNIKIPTFIKK